MGVTMVSYKGHPCYGLSKKHREAFEQIGVGQTPYDLTDKGKKVLIDLLERELIGYVGMKQLGKDCFGVIEVPEFMVPIPIHYQWCKWCSKNVKDEELE